MCFLETKLFNPLMWHRVGKADAIRYRWWWMCICDVYTLPPTGERGGGGLIIYSFLWTSGYQVEQADTADPHSVAHTLPPVSTVSISPSQETSRHQPLPRLPPELDSVNITFTGTLHTPASPKVYHLNLTEILTRSYFAKNIWRGLSTSLHSSAPRGSQSTYWFLYMN